MRIDVTRLGDGQSAVLSETWDPKELDLEVPGIAFLDKLQVSADVKRESAVLKTKIKLISRFEIACSRCGKVFEKPLNLEFDFLYPIDLSKRIISLDDDIREELILNYPQKNLCKPDCKGLCSRCGADLNEGVCRCKRNE
ncbi:MAG TPA: DUF177 domain-containing protein [Candidatus Omnitrophota bacterium]|nr:DUF177 domain-containing protein [Candidatus Omnitrophota bacterium]